ncbi:MAG TPA: isoprenylcysteine carboxylmethyltransferase family protein [Phenylobacterium sp.]|nr:isoprenylcysteine carboxylmethyltransferase family protein [Phenylobacterium sp.]
MIASLAVLALVTAQRLGELVLAQRNTRELLSRGGVESGAAHYPLIVALHAAWLAGLWFLAWDRPIHSPWLVAYIVLQALRAWTLWSLGRRWTTRIITVPGETLVRRGPYRFMRHPNYLVVVGEIAVLPLVFGLWGFALGFSVLNALMLAIRIRAESQALAGAER